MKSPIFRIIRDYLTESLKGKCFLRTTKYPDNKQYYIINLPRTRELLLLLGKQWIIAEHHVSVYEDQTLSEENFQSTYHYTAKLQSEQQERIAHVYFDRYGECCYYHLKDTNNSRLYLNQDDEALLKSYAEAASIHLISSICHQANNLAVEFENKFELAMKNLENASKGLQTETKRNINAYLKQIEICLQHLEKLALYTYDSRQDIRKIIELTKSYLMNKLGAMKYQEKSKRNESKEEIITHAELSVLKSASSKESDKLKAIEKQLEESENINIPAEKLLEQYRLLNEKFKLLKDSDINQIVAESKKYNQIRLAIREELIKNAKVNDLTTVMKLASFVDDIPDTTFFLCAKEGYGEVLKFLIIKFKFNINQINHRSGGGLMAADTLLLTAISGKKIEVIKMLLELKANPNIKNSFLGTSPLISAASSNQTAIVDLLLKYKADPNVKWCREKSTLIIAATPDPSIAVLLQKVMDEKDTEWTPLHIACKNDSLEIIKLLLAHKADYRIQDADKFTPLLARTCDVNQKINQEIVSALLANGDNVDQQHPTRLYTSLFFSCQQGWLEEVKFFIRNGANPNTPCMPLISSSIGLEPLLKFFDGERSVCFTPFMKAVSKGFVEIVEFLLEQKNKPIDKANLFNAYLLTIFGTHNPCAQIIAKHCPEVIEKGNAVVCELILESDHSSKTSSVIPTKMGNYR